VVYGQSGVGKSSLVQAGLVPALRQRAIDARDVLPVLLQVYTNWEKNLGDRLVESLEEVQGLSLPLFLDSMAAFIAEIQKSDDKNLLTVLIFDQFEEFFFAYKDPALRRPFFEFLRDCLNVPYVKVILSLREDYLHYLLECNRLTHLDVIDNNILDRKILYYLGNFSPEDGRAVIQNLTEACQFSLEPALRDELVRDLAGELNEVRPIELQVVGAQMQTERVTTLAQYMAEGPKERFVGRFLEEVVTDCGTNNQQFAKIILYLLTDDNLTRPLKTRGELDADLSIEPKRLDLILNILVKSGLVFQVPGFPADRYQLVHDYLVPLVRQQQAAGLVAELEKEREQRKLTEEKLNKALTQQLKTARRSMWTFAGLTVAIGGFGVIATVVASNIYFSSLIGESFENYQLDKLVSSIKAVKKLKALPVAISEIKLLLTSEINSSITDLKEMNRLEVDTNQVNQIIFSPNGQLIASLSEEKVAKVWNVEDGKLLVSTEHEKGAKISAISFSADSKMMIYASNDQKVNFWTVSGDKLKELSSVGDVRSISVSSDNNLLATSVGEVVVVWDLSKRKIIHTLKGGTGIITSMSFSPDGKEIASASQNNEVRIWSLESEKVVKVIDNYDTTDIRFTSDGKMLVLTNDYETKYYTLDGILTKRTQSDFGKDQAISPNGKLYVRSYGGTIKITDEKGNTTHLQSSYVSTNLDGRKSYLRFSPDGKFIASATGDRKISLWKTDKLTEISKGGRIYSTKFSPDGQMIASNYGSNDASESVNGRVEILNKNGELQRTIQESGEMLNFSPDGQGILTKYTKYRSSVRAILDRLRENRFCQDLLSRTRKRSHIQLLWWFSQDFNNP
jgi:WD40 repeat protein